MPAGRSRQALPCPQPRVERVGLRRRWLLASTAIGVAGCLAFSQLVYADNECGAINNAFVSCTPAGNNYTGGISYNPEDLVMVVQDGVTIAPSSGIAKPNIRNHSQSTVPEKVQFSAKL